MTSCPCCHHTQTQARPPRTQANGLVVVNWKCLFPGCQFSWSTINGRITKASLSTIPSHRDRPWGNTFQRSPDPDQQAHNDRFDSIRYQQP